MVYSMPKNRYCERISRQHKSNNVIYVVDLRKAVYYQKCHDPDCRGYRSPLRQIPVHVFSNSSVVIGSSEILDEKQLLDNDWSHKLDDSDRENFLPYDANVEDNNNDSWWLEAIKAVEDIENKQTKTQPSTKEVIDDGDDKRWLDVERNASQAEVTYSN